MKKIIQEFLDSKKIAIVGVSENPSNFGRSLMNELTKKGYEVLPVNPKCENVAGIRCYQSVKELPADVESVILAVPPAITEEVVAQIPGTGIKRVWMHRGAGKGAYSETAREQCNKHGIGVVYGFCPMMFFGSGMHNFHLWIRKSIGKVPREFKMA